MLREIAEYPNAFGPLGPDDERIDTGRYTLCMGPGKRWNTVQRQRFPVGEVDEVLAEVRAALRSRGRPSTQWEVGSSAPDGLVDALLDRGLKHDDDPYAVALVLTSAPAPVEGFVARRVETFEEFAEASAVQWHAFGSSEERIAESEALLPSLWENRVGVMHAVWRDREIVSAGTSAPTEHGLLLYGGATAEHARGRGAYRALLRARWEEAVARDTPALITQGGSMSRPILERMGFEAVGHLHILVDDFDSAASANVSPETRVL